MCVRICLHMLGCLLSGPGATDSLVVRGPCEQVCVSVQVNSPQTREKTFKRMQVYKMLTVCE